jgi:opacity protein-like surface antigen
MTSQRFARVAALAVAIALPVAAHAQNPDPDYWPHRDRTPTEFERRSSGSFSIMQSRPQGELANNIGFGYGASGAYQFRLDRDGYFSLRLDAGVLQYGNETKRVPLSSTIGGRIQVDVSTSNYLVPVTIGPQLQWPRGSVRPYVHAGVGGQFFWTQSSVDGSSDTHDFASTTNQHDATGVWMAGGGVLFPVHEKKTKVSVDLGLQYFGGGEAQYLRPGSIEDLPDNQIRLHTFQSRTNMVLVRLGVRVGI